MGFTNYLTSYKAHLLRHVRDVFTFNDTSGLSEAEIKGFVSKLTSDSAIPIPQESFQWLSNYFRWVTDKENLLVYDNRTGLWHFEDTDTKLRNILTDYFTVIAEEAALHKDMVFRMYAKYFFNVGRIPNLTNRIKTAIIFDVGKSNEVVGMTEKYRYFTTSDGTRALIDMSRDKWNLKTVTFKDTQPLLLTNISPVPISTTDEEPKLFLSLIEDYMLNDPERIDYFHKVLAYMMSPYNYNQVLIFLIGDEGRNGKSTLLKVLQDILGPQVVRLNSELLNASPASSFKKDDALVATEGKSLLIFNEIDERMQVSTQNVKDLTEGGRDEFGNKVMTVLRPAYSKNFEVNICGIPVVAANTLFNFSDWANLAPIFKRMILVPFDYIIVNEDPTIVNRLAEEYPKIQAWLYLNYFKHKGIRLKEVPKPKSVEARFISFVEDSDIIKMFWNDSIEITGSQTDDMLRGDIYRMYEVYCKVNGRKPIRNKGTNGFQNMILPYIANLQTVHSNGLKYFRGIKRTTYYDKEINIGNVHFGN